MRSILKSTAILSSGWLVSLVLGLVSAKVTALLVGPVGVGFLGLLQSTMGLATLVAMTAGLGTAVVRGVSRARGAGDAEEEAAFRSAAWSLCALLASTIAVVMLLFAQPIGRLMLGRSDRTLAIVPLAFAVVLTIVATVQAALLAAHGRIKELAKLGVSNSVLAPINLIVLVAIWREQALPWALLGGSIASVVVSRRYVRLTAPGPDIPVPRGRTASSMRELLRLVVPVNATTMAGTGVQLALPFLVLHQLGSSAVGYYRAALGISQMYLGFVAPTMGQDYYPRAAACADDRAALNDVINDQVRAMLVIVGPVILGTLTLIPYLVRLVYTPEFQPAVSILEWQMTADVLRITASAMGFAILARSGGTLLLYGDLIAATSLLVLAVAGLRGIGLEGVGIALFASSIIGYVAYWLIMRRIMGFRMTRRNRTLITAVFCGALIIRALSLAGLDHLRLSVGLTFAAAAAWTSWRIVRAEFGGLSGMSAIFSSTTTS